MNLRYSLLLALVLALPGVASGQIMLNPSDDAYVESSTAGTNDAKGASDPGRLWIRSSASTNRWIYLKFNVGTITNVTRAVLRVTVDLALQSTPNSAYRADVLTAASDAWSEATITAANAPAVGTTPIVSQEFQRQGSTDPDQTYDIDVTQYVQQQLAGDKVVTLVLRDLVSSSDVRIYSAENTVGADGPKLVITGMGTAAEDDARALGFTARLVGARPARGGAAVAVTLDAPGTLTAAVYDARGRHVATLADALAGAGSQTLAWDADGAPAGVYFVRVAVDGRARTLPVTLVR